MTCVEEPKVYRLHGLWKNIAEAIEGGARTKNEVANRLVAMTGKCGKEARRMAWSGVGDMMHEGLVVHDHAHGLFLTARGREQMMAGRLQEARGHG